MFGVEEKVLQAASGVPRVVVQSRFTAVPQGLCAGPEPLLLARLSPLPAGGAQGLEQRKGRAGAACKEKAPSALYACLFLP